MSSTSSTISRQRKRLKSAITAAAAAAAAGGLHGDDDDLLFVPAADEALPWGRDDRGCGFCLLPIVFSFYLLLRKRLHALFSLIASVSLYFLFLSPSLFFLSPLQIREENRWCEDA